MSVQKNIKMGHDVEMALPLHLQRLERSLNIYPFLTRKELFKDHVSDDKKSMSSELSGDDDNYSNSGLNEREEARISKLRLYNMENIGDERAWLQDVLLSDSSDSQSGTDNDEPITEEDFQDMLKFHILRKKYQGKFYQKPDNIQYQYYSSGLLSNIDRFPDHQKLIVGNKKKKDKKIVKIKKEKIIKPRKPPNKNKDKDKGNDGDDDDDNDDNNGDGYDYGDGCGNDNLNKNEWNKIIPKEEEFDDSELDIMMKNQSRARGKKKHTTKSPEMMALRRRKIWIMMSKKELGKIQRSKTNNHKEMLISCKKVAQNCMKYWRQKAMHSQKNMKETVWRAKRLTREMQTYWKRYDRVERETRRRLEKEAEEQRKMDVELIEVKRQQRKLNFLITQTELYAHFMSKKLGKSSPEEQLRILSQLDEEKIPRLADIDDYDSEIMKQKAKKNAIEAFDHDRSRTRQFDTSASAATSSANKELCLNNTPDNLEHPQPSIFMGNLKGYQLKGMNWLANLYDQGISGILADEMGLGKTVQSIAFLCHVAERYSVWGPFLIISPASTLHNWQQEMARFVPPFKVVPYWGNPQERKILRQFWDTKDLHTKDASFHVVITSYQLVITDYKYFNRIKWQYMILDEAQAIKSTSSMRWKLLLGFSCRNRLLLSGTPIQNSMAELWALLHFIMPTLFDSHDEFNEWFSKDIESHAENKTGIDEKHLSRLHMILKPFMLRRIKKDVENELSDKIEIMVYCPLTRRQKLLYSALKQKIRIEDLLHYTVGGGGSSNGGNDSTMNDKNFTSNLMNLVMQFRKVCNHPELFERRDAKSPYFMITKNYNMPSLLYNDGIIDHSIPSKKHLLYNKLSIFTTQHIHHSLFNNNNNNNNDNNIFSFSRLIGLSPSELNYLHVSGILYIICHATIFKRKIIKKRYWDDWWIDEDIQLPNNMMLIVDAKNNNLLENNIDLIFTKRIFCGEPVYTHTDHVIHTMPETMTHRILRSSKIAGNIPIKLTRGQVTDINADIDDDIKLILLPEHQHRSRPSEIRSCQVTSMPSFICDNYPKIQASPRKLYVSDSSAACAWKRHEECGGPFGKKIIKLGCEYALLSTPDFEPSIAVDNLRSATMFSHETVGGLSACTPVNGWSNIIVPDKQTLVTDAGKLSVLDNLLKRLKEQGHRVLIYSQMTKMIDLLEEYMYHRKHTFMRLDGSSKISDRRDMVADFQKRADIFVFLLSTRAGGLGINLTAADTVIFYDSDWNPTVDQQAMDRAHRLGQTKQVTVYRLICKGTIEERILQRAREKSEIQRMVISGGNFKPDTLKPKEVVSLLLDDEEIEAKYSQRSEERKQDTTLEDVTHIDCTTIPQHHKEKDRKRKLTVHPVKINNNKRPCTEDIIKIENQNDLLTIQSDNEFQNTSSQLLLNEEIIIDNDDIILDDNLILKSEDETSNEGLVVDVDGPIGININQQNRQSTSVNDRSKVTKLGHHFSFGVGSGVRIRPTIRGTSKRGRPRGSRRGGQVSGKGRGGFLPGQIGTTPQSPGGSCHSPPSSSSSTDQIAQQGLQGIVGLEGDCLSTVNTSNTSGQITPVRCTTTGVRRGPGRPRLRPAGPGNQGQRTPTNNYNKRVQKSLPVPLRSNQLSNPTSNTLSPNPSSINISPVLLTNVQKQSTSVSNLDLRPFGFYTQQQQQQQQQQLQQVPKQDDKFINPK
ncbi:chromatin-remodeling ATPase INO80-like isoform X1 [Aphidius gifuensis]|uniref:chromatin-remodeling ATPase INO80-like isoform X1 n=1 Tax=Aphidius gifuensis TaxID=684658 RepID=UPI001CDD7B8A|nr:chromatin-remodeling ATPase INO80-like isoform X1 [Aphidius gifuensis]XP_044009154.1 chromatin-remodeling ATPase INO80-like isoform X1 [Aphidius gifuensis]